MKVVQSLFVAAVFSISSVSSFAQSDAPVSRAQVRAELVALEQAGYQPGAGDQVSYPSQIEAAEARVAERHSVATGFGGIPSVSSASGVPFKPTTNFATKSIYFGH